MAKGKVKRYNDEGYVTSDDSNAGMKEAYDEGALERANASEESQAIMNEAKGDAMLKAMRDETAKPRTVSKAAPKASQTFPMTPAPKYEPKSSETKKTPAVGRAGQGSGFERSTEKYDKLKKDIEARQKSSVTNPSILSRLFSTSSQRSRPYKTETMAKGGMTASKRADGIAQKGKTRGKMY